MRGLIVGTGPSLRAQLDLIPRFDGLVFICNNCFTDIPTADVWLACDPKWHELNGRLWRRGEMDCWHWSPEICEKYNYIYVEGVWIVDGKEYPRSEHETPPGPAGGLYMGTENKISLNHCSGAQLLNLAANQYGCDTILLIGHDFRYVPGEPRHFFKGLSDIDGEYPPSLRKHSLFDKGGAGNDLMQVYKHIAEQYGLPPIINCTPDSALPWFEMGNFEDYI
jgi:hypothetical protein